MLQPIQVPLIPLKRKIQLVQMVIHLAYMEYFKMLWISEGQHQ